MVTKVSSCRAIEGNGLLYLRAPFVLKRFPENLRTDLLCNKAGHGEARCKYRVGEIVMLKTATPREGP